MEPTSMGARRTAVRWIAAIALLVLAGGIAVALRPWGQAGREAPDERPGQDAGETAGDPIARALGLTEAEDEKSRWVEEIPGLDVSGLDPERVTVLLRHANTRRCTCGCGYTLAACRVYDSTCEESLPGIEALRDSVARGWIATAEGQREAPERSGSSPAER